MGINESEVVVDFLYKVRWQGESSEGLTSTFRVLIAHQIRISVCDLLLKDLDDEVVKFVWILHRLRRFGAAFAC